MKSYLCSRSDARLVRFLFLLLFLISPTAIDAAEPPEVEKLKGLHVLPDGAVRLASERKVASIPGWKSRSGAIIFDTNRKGEPKLGLKVIERESLAAFVITKHYPDLSYTILDVRAIPLSHIHNFTEFCERQPPPKDARIMALAVPEKCQEETRRVVRAWQVDHTTGQIQDIPRAGVICSFPGIGMHDPKCEGK